MIIRIVDHQKEEWRAIMKRMDPKMTDAKFERVWKNRDRLIDLGLMLAILLAVVGGIVSLLWVARPTKPAQLTFIQGSFLPEYARLSNDLTVAIFHNGEPVMLIFCDGSTVLVGEVDEASAVADAMKHVHPDNWPKECARPL